MQREGLAPAIFFKFSSPGLLWFALLCFWAWKEILCFRFSDPRFVSFKPRFGVLVESKMEGKHSPRSARTTNDILTWSESPPVTPPKSENGASHGRSRVPAGGISSISFTEQVTSEKEDSFCKRRPCSGSKWKEMTGSGIFKLEESHDGTDATNVSDQHAATRLHQQAAGIISQINFGAEETVTPKKPTSIPEVAKQKELSGNLETSSDIHFRRQISEAKAKELSGHDIFGPTPEVPPRSSGRSLAHKEEPNDQIKEPSERKASVKPSGGLGTLVFGEETPTKTTKKMHNQKFAELSGNNIFKGEAHPSSAEKSLSTAKLREMTGSNIFADEKVENRDYFGGVRKPPGGESSLTLV